MPTAITEQITAGSQVQPIHFLSIQSFTLASFIMRGVTALTYGLVSFLCIHISRHGNTSHLTLWTTAQMLFKEKMYWTLSQQSRGEKQEYTHTTRSHTHTWGQFTVSISLTALSWKAGSPGEIKRGQNTETAHKKARSFPAVRKMATRTQWVLSCSASPPTEGYSKKSILSLMHI